MKSYKLFPLKKQCVFVSRIKFAILGITFSGTLFLLMQIRLKWKKNGNPGIEDRGSIEEENLKNGNPGDLAFFHFNQSNLHANKIWIAICF